jgi:hypothetical protein
MAVYQGARPYSTLFPGRVARRDAVPSVPRRRLRGAVRAGRRPSRVGFLIGAIVLAFLLAFFWLAQTVRVSATSYDIDRMAADRDALGAQLSDLQSDLNRLGREPAIRKQAIDAGLAPLPAPLVVPASSCPVRLQKPIGTPASRVEPDCTVPCTVIDVSACAAVAGTTEAAASSAPRPIALLIDPE